MKTKVLLIVLLLFGAANVFAAKQTEKIIVKGNCGMCETRIEKTVLAIDGVSKADWDKMNKKLKVVFDDSKTSIDNIEIEIAKVGHDTANHKTTAEVYNNLPECCKYDRNVEMKDAHKSNTH